MAITKKLMTECIKQELAESIQAETRARALAFATRQTINPDMPLVGQIFTAEQAVIENK